MTGLANGSTATEKSSFRLLMTSETPVMVPPVPTPVTKTSIFPSVAFHISSAVVKRWISGFASFSNCWGQFEFRTQHFQQYATLQRHGFRHCEDQSISSGRRYEGQGNPCVAGGRLDDDTVPSQGPIPFPSRYHGVSDAVLHTGERVEKFTFDQYIGINAFGHTVQFYEGCIADGLGYILCRKRHGQSCNQGPSAFFCADQNCGWERYVALACFSTGRRCEPCRYHMGSFPFSPYHQW